MILLDPKVEVENYDGMQIMKNIERAMRICYRTEGSTTEDSYKRLLNLAITSGHGSVMEHEKITARFLCSLNSYKDLTRHRTGVAFSIESTRWCNYSKDKFGNELKFIKPIFYVDNWADTLITDNEATEDEIKSRYWFNTMDCIERNYMSMAAAGARPDELRTMLPHSTAAQVVMTCNIREWRHIFSLRTTPNVHFEIRQILIPLLLKFKQDMPELFNDIVYDEAFPQQYYAEVLLLD